MLPFVVIEVRLQNVGRTAICREHLTTVRHQKLDSKVLAAQVSTVVSYGFWGWATSWNLLDTATYMVQARDAARSTCPLRPCPRCRPSQKGACSSPPSEMPLSDATDRHHLDVSRQGGCELRLPQVSSHPLARCCTCLKSTLCIGRQATDR
jgi:hypothetical protein